MICLITIDASFPQISTLLLMLIVLIGWRSLGCGNQSTRSGDVGLGHVSQSCLLRGPFFGLGCTAGHFTIHVPGLLGSDRIASWASHAAFQILNKVIIFRDGLRQHRLEDGMNYVSDITAAHVGCFQSCCWNGWSRRKRIAKDLGGRSSLLWWCRRHWARCLPSRPPRWTA